jgi:hypothetical protein
MLPAALHSALDGSVDWDLATISHRDDVYFTSVDIQIRGAGEDRLRLTVTPGPPP